MEEIKQNEDINNNSQILQENRNKIVRNAKGQLPKGCVLNPLGRKKGNKSFTTLMDETVKQIAKENKISKGEVWRVLITTGYHEAKNGNYPYFKDLLDRYYGKPKERIGLGVDGEGIEGVEIKIITKEPTVNETTN